MRHTYDRLPYSFTAFTATVAVLAAVGLTFLLLGPSAGGASVFIVPVSALLLTSVMTTKETYYMQHAHRVGSTTAKIDPHTHLASVPVFEHVLQAEFAAAERGRPLTVVLFGIEDFRRYSTMNGREAGERLLSSAGRLLKRRTRGMNLSARYAARDATFVTILSGIPLEGAVTFVKRVKKDLASLPSTGEPLSVSAGVAGYTGLVQDAEALMGIAERALTKAKKDGGNRVVIYGQRTESGAVVPRENAS